MSLQDLSPLWWNTNTTPRTDPTGNNIKNPISARAKQLLRRDIMNQQIEAQSSPSSQTKTNNADISIQAALAQSKLLARTQKHPSNFLVF